MKASQRPAVVAEGQMSDTLAVQEPLFADGLVPRVKVFVVERITHQDARHSIAVVAKYLRRLSDSGEPASEIGRGTKAESESRNFCHILLMASRADGSGGCRLCGQ